MTKRHRWYRHLRKKSGNVNIVEEKNVPSKEVYQGFRILNRGVVICKKCNVGLNCHNSEKIVEKWVCYTKK